MALVSVPEPLAHMGVTVMCGPFFSVMPFPPRGLHSLSHVRYTPHAAWSEGTDEKRYQEPFPTKKVPDTFFRRSHFSWMLRDAIRYLPILNECRYVDSLWEIKTVLPRSEQATTAGRFCSSAITVWRTCIACWGPKSITFSISWKR